MRSALINTKLFEQFENEGREVKYKERRGRAVAASVIDPIQKLFQNGYISHEEASAANKYSHDFELSICDNYAHAVYSGLPAGTTEFGFEDKRSQASIRVNDVKMLVSHLSNHRQRRLKKKLAEKFGCDKSTTYQKILACIVEKRLSVNRLSETSGLHKDTIKNKAQEVIKIIYNYYTN